MKNIWLVGFCFGICVNFGIAQTTVTTDGGITNAIPKFSGNTTLSGSSITEVNGNVGIGTAMPSSLLSVSGQVVIGSPYRGDASLHITQSYGGFGRFIQIAPVGNSQSALNLMSDTNSFGNNEWWAWGVNNNTWTIQPGISFGGLTGFFVNPSGNITVANSYSKTDTDLRSLAQFQSNDVLNPSYLALYATGGTSQATRSVTFQTAETNTVNAGNLNLQVYGGNVGIGTMTPGAKLDVAGNVKLSGSGASITFPDGSTQSTAWSGTLGGGDYAESIDVAGIRSRYEPGDVIIIDLLHPGSFLKSSTPYSRFVAGIYSTKPGMIGRRQTSDQKTSTNEIPMAMVGIVPTKVTTENGPIEVGDLIVTSSSPGYAMKGSDEFIKPGVVIGKALGSLSFGVGVVEVLVSLQ